MSEPKITPERGESCGLHYPDRCPSSCQFKGDRFSKRQIEAQDKPKIVAECWTCTDKYRLSEMVRALALIPERPMIALPSCRAAGHDVRPMEVKP